MKSLAEINGILHDHRIELRENYGVSRMGIFGSLARGRCGQAATWTSWWNSRSKR